MCRSAVFVTANVSGGHLNPAVTTATIISGHTSFCKALAFFVMQVSGAILGCLLQVCPAAALHGPSYSSGC